MNLQEAEYIHAIDISENGDEQRLSEPLGYQPLLISEDESAELKELFEQYPALEVLYRNPILWEEKPFIPEPYIHALSFAPLLLYKDARIPYYTPERATLDCYLVWKENTADYPFLGKRGQREKVILRNDFYSFAAYFIDHFSLHRRGIHFRIRQEPTAEELQFSIVRREEAPLVVDDTTSPSTTIIEERDLTVGLIVRQRRILESRPEGLQEVGKHYSIVGMNIQEPDTEVPPPPEPERAQEESLELMHILPDKQIYPDAPETLPARVNSEEPVVAIESIERVLETPHTHRRSPIYTKTSATKEPQHPKSGKHRRSRTQISTSSEPDDEPTDEELAKIEEEYLSGESHNEYHKGDDDDPTKLDVTEYYFRTLHERTKDYPLLTLEDEIDLARRIERGDDAQEMLENSGKIPLAKSAIQTLQDTVDDGLAARYTLIRSNERLVISVAKKYMGRGVPFIDLIQEGQLGLLRAISKYEYKRGHKFSTYATWWIRQAVTRANADKGHIIRIPVHMNDRVNHMRYERYILTQKLGREPTFEELAIILETSPEEVENMIKISRQPLDLDTPVGDEEDSTFGDFLEDETSPAPPEQAEEYDLHEILAKALRRLDPREEKILRLRYGLEDGKHHTLEEIAQKIGVTRERIRQLEAQALKRLRHSSSSPALRDYLRG